MVCKSKERCDDIYILINMNRDWDRVFFKSSAYWMCDLRGKGKEIDISTNISSKGDDL